VTSGRAAALQPVERRARHLDDDEQQEDEDAAGGERLELAVAVGMVGVGRLAGARIPMSPMMFDAESVREWKPSEMMLTAPVA
jgi:hypothetical protein